MLTVFRYVAIMLSALALALGLTHALAVTPDPRLAAFSVALQVMATLCAIVLTARMRQRPGFWLAFSGASMFLIATLIWATSMAPGPRGRRRESARVGHQYLAAAGR